MTPNAALAAIAAWGLDCASPPTPTAPLADDVFEAMLRDARSNRVLGPLAWMIDANAWPATDEQRSQSLDAHRIAMSTVLILERRLVEIARLFETRGIDWRLLKGPAIAHLDEREPSLRSFGDLDLLVRSDDLRGALDLLIAQGGRRRYAEPRPGFDQRFGKGSCVVLPDGPEIDLHRTLSPGPFGLRLPLADLFDHADQLALGGSVVPTLGPAARFLHACFHAMLGQPEPLWAHRRDVVVTCPTDPQDLLAALALAARADAEVVIAAAVDDAVVHLRWQPPAALASWRAAFNPTGPARRRMVAARATDRSPARVGLASLAAVPLADKPAYALALLWPETTRTGSRADRIRRALRGPKASAR